MPDEELFASLERAPSEWERDEIDQFSEQLGPALMPAPVLQRYTGVLERTLAQLNQGLRLKLHFLGSARKYRRYPWEAVKINGQHLAMDPRLSLTRTVDFPQPEVPVAVDKPPFRILLVIAEPRDLASYQADEEVKNIEAILQPLVDSGLLQLETHYNLPLTQMVSLLRQKDYHIFYFSGYANLDAEGNGAIYLVDDDERAVGVEGRRFASFFIGSGVRLAFLDTGVGVFGRGMGGGLADALLQVGLPIVMGHTYMVTNLSAREFSQGFFNELVKTNSVAQAVFAGRRAIIRAKTSLRNEWLNPVLLMRTQEGRFLAGEAAYKIETFIREGRLVTEAKPPGEFDAATFIDKLQTTRESLTSIRLPSDEFKANQLIDEAEFAIRASSWDMATQRLSEASSYIYLVVSKQERVQAEQQRERRARWTVLGVSVFLLVIVAVLGYLLRDVWSPEMTIPVVSLPVSVVVWSFIGGVAAMLQAFVGTKSGESKAVSYEWMLWRPVVGVIMGSVVYLAIAGGLIVLGQGDATTLAQTRNIYILWALAFLGGFSDRFAILVFDNIVRTVDKSNGELAEGESPEAPRGESKDSTNSS